MLTVLFLLHRAYAQISVCSFRRLYFIILGFISHQSLILVSERAGDVVQDLSWNCKQSFNEVASLYGLVLRRIDNIQSRL